MHGDKVELISDGTVIIGSYILRYIKKPVEMNLVNNDDCELADHTHSEIVDTAVTMALENIASPRYQSHMVESMSRE